MKQLNSDQNNLLFHFNETYNNPFNPNYPKTC